MRIYARFVNGPARGRELELTRAPIVLRVTRSPKGMFSALCAPGAAPDGADDCYPYLLRKAAPRVDVPTEDQRPVAEWAEYRLLTPEDIPFPKGVPYLRDYRVFKSWLTSHEARLRALHLGVAQQ